jgi:hypothetical protein
MPKRKDRPLAELAAESKRRLTRPRSTRGAKPHREKQYTVLLRCPHELTDDTHSGVLVHLAHVEATGVHAAIGKAQDDAVGLFQYASLAPEDFEPLLVLLGHHDARSF